MADQKLSELSFATGASSSDLLYVVAGGTSKKIAVSSLINTFSTSFTGKFVLPVLNSTSNAVTTTGSTFIHSVENKIRWFDGVTWQSIG